MTAIGVTHMAYSWTSEVRVNETDLQGIVNNANYFIYMTQARHKHLQSLGIDLAKLHQEGFDLVLVHTDIYFKASLKSDDEFTVTSSIKFNSKIRVDFEQEIIRKSDSKIVATATSTTTCVSCQTGRPFMPEFLQTILAAAVDAS